MEIDGYAWRYALIVVHATKEEDPGVYGFALFDEFVGTDPLDRVRFARNVLDFLVCWHMIF